MKHAYLIIAHNEPKILKVLLSLIDDSRNDIFIHIDKKAKAEEFGDLHVLRSGLFRIEPIDVRWGDLSLVKCEMALFEAALRHGGYARYHLISGVDLPIKTQDYIHHLLDDLHPNAELVGYKDDTEANALSIKRRTQYYYFFSKYRRKSGVGVAIKIVNRAVWILQDALHIYRKYPYELKKGCNWVSITNDFCEYLVSRKEDILNLYKRTCCSDEIFLHSVLWNSPYRKNIYRYGEGEYAECLRYIVWLPNSCSPQNLDASYKDDLMLTDALFARKFSSKDMYIVNYTRWRN